MSQYFLSLYRGLLFLGVFLTGLGSIFYLGFMLISLFLDEGYYASVFYFIFEEFDASALGILVSFLICAVLHFTMSFVSRKYCMINKTQYLFILAVCFVLDVSYFGWYHFGV